VPSRLDAGLYELLVTSLGRQVLKKDASLDDGRALVLAHPQICAELAELLDVLEARIDHVHWPLDTHRDVPLQAHARYTILVFLGLAG
jgi:hypothetical protein